MTLLILRALMGDEGTVLPMAQALMVDSSTPERQERAVKDGFNALLEDRSQIKILVAPNLSF